MLLRAWRSILRSRTQKGLWDYQTNCPRALREEGTRQRAVYSKTWRCTLPRTSVRLPPARLTCASSSALKISPRALSPHFRAPRARCATSCKQNKYQRVCGRSGRVASAVEARWVLHFRHPCRKPPRLHEASRPKAAETQRQDRRSRQLAASSASPDRVVAAKDAEHKARAVTSSHLASLFRCDAPQRYWAPASHRGWSGRG